MKDWKKDLRRLLINIYRLLFDAWDVEIIERGTDTFIRPKITLKY